MLDLHRDTGLDLAALRKFAGSLGSSIMEARDRNFTVALVPDDRMRELNSTFRGKTGTTDVLSFPHAPDEFDQDVTNLGDIVISVEQARRQASENGLTLEGEIKQLMLHGLLHLCGYDHENDNGEMDARELELRQTLNI